MPLPAAVQDFAVNASAFLAGIDAMLERTDKLAVSIDEVIAAADRMSGAFNAAAGADDRFAAAEEAAEARAVYLADAMDRVVVGLDESAAASDRAMAATDALAASYDRAGNSAVVAGDKAAGSGEKAAAFGHAWKTALLGVGIAAVYGIEQAAKFQSNMEQLHTQAGVAQGKLAGLSQQVLQLAGQVGEGPESLSDSLYHVASNLASTGASGQQMLNAVKVAAEGAQVGGANLVDVTNALGAAIASGIPGVQNYTQAMGYMNATVGAGDMHMQDLADAFGIGLLANIKMYGVTLRDVSAALATYGDNNIRGAKAGTDLRMAVQGLVRQGPGAAATLSQLGLGANSLRDAMKSGGLNSALEMLIKHMKAAGVTAKDQGQVITDLFGKKAGSGIGVLVGEFDRFQGKYRDVKKGADQFGADWTARTKTMSQQWNDLKSGAQALAISFGTVLLPAATKVVGVMAKFAAMLEQHPAIAAFAGAMLAVAAAFKLAAMAADLFKIAEIGAFGWIGIAVVAVIALAAGLYELYTHSKLVRDIVADVGKFFKAAWSDAMKGADAVIKWFVNGPLAWIKGNLKIFAQFWAAHGAEVKQIAHEVWHLIAGYVEASWKRLDTVVRVGLAILKPVWRVAWGVIKDTVVLAWNVMSGIVRTAMRVILDIIGVALDIFTGHWSRAWNDAKKLISDALNGIRGIMLTFANGALHLLWDAGVNIVKGLIGGIESMASAPLHAIESVGHGIIGVAKNIFQWASPSKVFYGLGVAISKGLALGIGESGQQAKDAAAKLSHDVRKAFLAGQITNSEEDSLLASIGKRLATDLRTVAARQDQMQKVMHEIGLKLVSGLVGSMEDATSASQAKTAVNKLIGYVQQAWRAGILSLPQATAMTKALDADSLKLQALATRREAIAKQITAAKNYAAQTTQNAAQWAGLSGVAGSMTSGAAMYSGNLLAGMQANLGQIRAFESALKKLAKLGLRRDLISQIIQMGPDQGLQVAEALIQGPGKVIAQMNATQHQLAQATSALGQSAANVMYDTGSQAGKGFLSGLKAQEGEMTKMMDRLAKSMVTSMKRELGGGHAGHGTGMNITVHVSGFIGSEQQLVTELYKAVQQESLRHSRRNGLSNGLSLAP
jgi:TP901 family phage tail tape measure protein